jgi:hypothetical protein
LSVMSDVASTSLLANGATISTGAFDQRDSQPITITFTDIQDGAIRVPETGFSFGLFFISLTGLFCASRFRCFRLA